MKENINIMLRHKEVAESYIQPQDVSLPLSDLPILSLQRRKTVELLRWREWLCDIEQESKHTRKSLRRHLGG